MRRRSLVAFAIGVFVGQVVLAQPANDRRSALIHYKNGWDLLGAEAWREAQQEFTKAIDLDPTLTLAYYGLGKAYMGLKEFSRAVQAYATCREQFRAQAGEAFTNQLDRNRRRQDRIRELKQTLREIQASRAPGQLSFQQQRSVQQIQEQILELERQLQRGDSVEIDLEIPAFVSLALGSAHFRTGNLSEAERYYGEAKNTNPKLGEAHNNLAVVYLETGRIDLAEKEVKLAEKVGYKVHPRLKEDIKARKGTL